MKQSKLLVVCLTPVLMGTCLASSCLGIELGQMQSLALQNREVVQQYVAHLEQSRQDVTLAKSTYYPSVDLSYTINQLDEASYFEAEQNSTAGIQVSYSVFSGFADRYNLQAAEIMQQVEALRLEGIRQDVQLNVALAYLDVYERRANRTVAESAFQTLEKVYKDGESRFQVGLIGKNELLKFRVDYDNADITLKAADAGLKKSVNNLSRQVGRTVSLDELDFRDFSALPTLGGKDGYVTDMLANRSEIKVLEAAIEAADAQAKAQESGYYPHINAIGSVGNYDDEFINGTGDASEEEWRAQLVMSINLFRGHSTEAAVAKAKLATRSAGYELAELKHSLQTSLDNLYVDAQVSLENVEVATRSIEQAEENLRITQLKYNEGLQRESDLLDAITSLSRAKYNYVTVMRSVFLNDFQLTRMVDGFHAAAAQ